MLGVIDAEKLDIYTLLLSQCSTPDTLIQTYSELETIGCLIQAQGSNFWGKSQERTFGRTLYSVITVICCVSPLKSSEIWTFWKETKIGKDEQYAYSEIQKSKGAYNELQLREEHSEKRELEKKIDTTQPWFSFPRHADRSLNPLGFPKYNDVAGYLGVHDC